MIILKILKDFFEPHFIQYEIKLSASEIAERLETIFYEQQTEINKSNLVGSIVGKEFTMGLITGDNSTLLGSALKGVITEKKAESSILEISIMRSSSAYLTFFLSIIGSLAYLVMYFTNVNSPRLLWYSLVTFIIGSTFSIWISNRSNAAIQKKFEIFLKEHSLY